MTDSTTIKSAAELKAIVELYLTREFDHRVLRRSLYYLAGPPTARRVWERGRKLRLAASMLERPRFSNEIRFRVPLKKITTPWGFSFAPGGWHPHVATLRQWLQEGNAPPGETQLHRLYEYYRPTSVQEALLEHLREPVQPLHSWPVQAGLLSVWSLTRYHVERALASVHQKKPRHRQFIGPTQRSQIESDLARLFTLYHSIRAHGYNPQEFGGPAIRGYFLVRMSDYRFVCRHGNHRLAVLSCLGYDEVEVALTPRITPIVDDADLRWWTVDHGGLYSESVARALFQKMFDEKGRVKATNVGILRGAGV